MESVFSATLGVKGQITLPKVVRDLLGLQEAGTLVGFVVDRAGRSARLTKLKVIPEEEDFSEEEYRKLLGLRRRKGGRRYSSLQALLKDLQQT